MIGVVPVAVLRPRDGGGKIHVREQSVGGGLSWLAVGLIATGAAVFAFQDIQAQFHGRRHRAAVESKPNWRSSSADDGLLSVTGIVRMPDGSPAARCVGASVHRARRARYHRAYGRDGAFSASGCVRQRLSAARGYARWSQSRRHHRAGARDAQSSLRSPLEVKLLPALNQRSPFCRRAPGRWSAGLRRGNRLSRRRCHRCGRQGAAPASRGRGVTELIAWHPTLGANGNEPR